MHMLVCACVRVTVFVIVCMCVKINVKRDCKHNNINKQMYFRARREI